MLQRREEAPANSTDLVLEALLLFRDSGQQVLVLFANRTIARLEARRVASRQRDKAALTTVDERLSYSVYAPYLANGKKSRPESCFPQFGVFRIRAPVPLSGKRIYPHKRRVSAAIKCCSTDLTLLKGNGTENGHFFDISRCRYIKSKSLNPARICRETHTQDWLRVKFRYAFFDLVLYYMRFLRKQRRTAMGTCCQIEESEGARQS
jgi:hypothetical protein